MVLDVSSSPNSGSSETLSECDQTSGEPLDTNECNMCLNEL